MSTRNQIQRRENFYFDAIIVDDAENNTFANIVESCYITCINRHIKNEQRIIPHFFEISDECLEFVCDNAIKTVTWNGMRINSMTAIDLSLKDILMELGLIFEENHCIINPYQIIMFEELC